MYSQVLISLPSKALVDGPTLEMLPGWGRAAQTLEQEAIKREFLEESLVA